MSQDWGLVEAWRQYEAKLGMLLLQQLAKCLPTAVTAIATPDGPAGRHNASGKM